MKKNINIRIDLAGQRHMNVRGCYAEYDSSTNTIRGYGEASSAKYRNMDFEPAFEAILYGRRNQINGIEYARSNGIFTKTGRMTFQFCFKDVTDYRGLYIRLSLIARDMWQSSDM